MNKKGQPLSMGILVFLVLGVCLLSLFYFITLQNGVKEDFQTVDVAVGVYDKADLITFYLQDSVSRASLGIGNEEEFVSDFVIVLESYKYPDGEWIFPEFESVINNLDVGDVSISDGEVSVLLKVNVEDSLMKRGKVFESGFLVDYYGESSELYEEVFSLSYDYEKEFIGEI